LVSIGTNAEAEPQAFAARCAESGLLVWRCMADGSVLLAPRLPAAIHALAACTRLGALIADKFASGGDGESRDLELYPGCWIACALDPTAPGGTFWVTLVPTELGLSGQVFEEICQSAALSPATAAEALQAFLKYTPVQKDQAIRTFVHFYETLTASRNDQAMIAQFTWKLSQAYEELNLFFRLARSLNTNADPVETIQDVCDELQQILPFRWVAASFIPGAARVAGLDGRTISAGALPCMPGMLTHAVKAACQPENAELWVTVHDPPKTALAKLARGQVIAESVSHGGAPIGAFLAGGKGGPEPEVTSEELQLLNAAAGFIGVFHENVARFAEQKALFLATVRSLAASIDAKDRYTRGHSERVSVLGAALARALGMDRGTVEQYRVAGLLHDVGKIGTPEAILTKVGRLTDDEFREIMKHPETGHAILKDIPGISFALPGVLHHHEKFDGTGYPARLAGERIPLIARVLALADTFDAMRSNRAYRGARPHEQVIAEIRRCAGTQFDPKLAAVFVNLDFSEFEEMLGRAAEPPLAA
jgi:HD-GYP domain-containing protein (c-di-GMP phosphodiesterase class II)